MSQDTPIRTAQLIAPLEKAARIYCVKAGFDPDVEISEPHAMMAGVVVSRFFWEVIAERMADPGMMLVAMKDAGVPAIPKPTIN